MTRAIELRNAWLVTHCEQPEAGDQEASTQNNILSAIWSRQCSVEKDFKFGTRSILRMQIGQLPPLDYSVNTSEAYRDLPVNTLRLTHSSELILAALRSTVPRAPSWTINWSTRQPLRVYSKRVGHRRLLTLGASTNSIQPFSTPAVACLVWLWTCLT